MAIEHVETDDIQVEALRWVQENKEFDPSTVSKGYQSPRISSEIPDCSMPMSFDNLNFCSLGCTYCFAYMQKAINPSRTDLGLQTVDIPKMIQAMTGKGAKGHHKLLYEHFYKRRFLLHWGGLADPFCNFERKIGSTKELLIALGDMDYPTLFSFKGNTVFHPEYRAILERFSHQRNFAFQVSIITADDKLAKEVEVGVPSPTARLRALKMLSDMGYWTILRLRPFMIGITDPTLDELLERALAAGIRGVSTEFFAIDNRCTAGAKMRFKWLAKYMGVENLHDYYQALSPDRGTYLRLNRHVKERFIKKIYTFCAKHGLTLGVSDPDFKELCTSGSCCGMPDNFADNKGLENWTRDQLTYHVKRARQIYHQTGKIIELRFDEVYNEVTSPYLVEPGLANDNFDVIGRNYAERANLTQKLLLQEKWNNLRSPINPRNYLHNKLVPVGLDDKGNYIVRYNPLEYEKRWTDEGIDLTL